MPRLRSVVVLLSLFSLAILTTGNTASGSPPGGGSGDHPYVPGEILVGFHPGAQALDRANARAQVNALKIKQFRSGAEHWKLGPGRSVEQAIAGLAHNPHVRYAEPNYILYADVIPDDPYFSSLWGMLNTGQVGGTADADIDADIAWDVSVGSANVLVGVIDTGVDYNHPDLAANVWTNPGEIPGNAIDDDNNGYVDDVHGYDFVNNDGNPIDDHGHGTHVSGTIGAIGDNGIGVAGVNWNVKIMGLKFLSAAGSGSTAGAIAAVDYSVLMGVDLTSNSWGGGGFSQALYDAIADAGAQEMAFVAAAGNSNANTDVTAHYPSSYNLPNIIAVAATDHNDAKASFSSYGLTTVDLGAPGVDILSTLPGNSYGVLSGTSMATPHVSGVCALIRAISPNIPVAQLKSVLLAAADPVASMAGKTVSGARLNAFFAIATPDDVFPDPILDLATANATSNTMGLTWTATGDDDVTGSASSYDVRYSTSPIDANSFDAATPVGSEPSPAPAGTSESMEILGLEADTTYYFVIKAFDEWGNDSGISNLATGTTLPPPTGSVSPTSISEALFTGEQAMHVVTLSNTGVGTLDFTIPTPSIGEPTASSEAPLVLNKDDSDPRALPPQVLGAGGPDSFGYRWIDSDEPGGPAFNWIDISATGTQIASLDGDDENSGPIPLGFHVPFYGSLFEEIRVSTNGWLSFTSTLTSYNNQPLPNSGAPENLVAPFWDDLHFRAAQRAWFQSFGTSAIVQWQNVDRYSTGSNLTFQVILEASGAITFQYLSLSGVLDNATVGIQNATKTDGLQVAFNQAYLHDNLAVRISAIPQWLSVAPTSGRIYGGQSIPLDVTIDAAGLEGGIYPGAINIQTNDPLNPVLTVDVSLDVTGAPDAAVEPASLAFGDRFIGLPDTMTLHVQNNGTDVLHVTGIASSHPELTASPGVFDVSPHATQEVTVTWTPSMLGAFSGSLTVSSNDSGEPIILVPVTGNAVPAPVMITTPSSFSETLFSGHTVTRTLTVQNEGGSDLIVDTAADQGNGGTGLVIGSGLGTAGSGGPDGFGYRWRDSDEPGGPIFSWVDISTTGTPITFSTADNALSPIISMGMTFPFYGTNFTQMKVSTNGWLTFNTADTATRSVNSTLPSTSFAVNGIAVFWDDLHLRTGDVRYLNDGARFILQYTNVGRLSPTTGQSYTFQIILYPTGRMVYQFLSMVGTLNSATIGIQDSTRTVATRVAFNQTYVHDNLAIQITRVPDWLTVTPANAVIPPGGSFPFNVNFDSTGRDGGLLSGDVVLFTNIPTQAEVRIPADLTVIGAPEVAVYPVSHDYGTVFAGYPSLTTLQVVNNGTEVLNVSDVVSTDPELFVETPPASNSVPEAAFPLTPGQAQLFNLRWSPALPYTMNAEVQIHSDDPVTPVLVMPVMGVAIPPPVAAWSPASFTESLNVGDVVHRTLHLGNNGASDLTFGTAFRLLGGTQVTVYEELELGEGEEDPRPGILGGGGPDMYGYLWKDSDEPGGPIFNWIDISGVGTPIAFDPNVYCDNCNAGPIPIGFSFPFYGNNFSQIRVTTNGWLSFTSTLTTTTNQALPNSGTTVPENLLAPFWDDMVHRSGTGSEPLPSHVYYYNDGTRFIIQYEHFYRLGDFNDDLNFEVILYPNGRIVYQYQTMTATLNSATIGIQNAAKNDGLTVAFNTAYMHDNLAVEIRSPFDYLNITPTNGTIPPGGSLDLDLTIDMTQQIGGDYFASLDLSTNDPANGVIGIPVTLHVTGIPDVVAEPTSLSFPTTFTGGTSVLPLTIRNVGTDVLHISGHTSSGEFSFPGLTTPVDLPVGGQISILATFAPTFPALHSTNLEIASDDPDTPLLVIPVSGLAVPAPVAVWSPSSFTESVVTGDVLHRTLHLENQGGSDLEFSYDVGILGGAPGALGLGGIDAFGYGWKDSDDPNGPDFDWLDISTIGTPVAGLDGDDENLGPIPIGFPFPFYGNVFNSLRVSTNGFASFTSTLTDSSNDPLPSTSGPPNLLAAFWDNLHFRSALKATYYNDGERFILQYTDVDLDTTGPTAHLTFQIILYPGGLIRYQYLTMDGALDSATIGIQNEARDIGLQVVQNAAYLHDNMAIEFRPGYDFLTVSPASGTVPAGGFADLDVAIDSMKMLDGDYSATIDLTTNDPANALIQVPVNVHLTGYPDIAADPSPLVFPATFVNFSSTLPLTIRNVGAKTLHITGFTTSGEFVVSGMTAPVELFIGQEIALTVTFAPTYDGMHAGSLDITSDDPDEPVFSAPFAGLALIPPVIEVAPPAITTALPPGGSRTKTVTIHNNGGSDLVWSAGTTSVSAAGAPVTVYTELELDRDEVDPRPGILGAGGPDLFGYRWKDSDEPGGPVFNWVDISGVGTEISFDPDGYCVDCTSGPFPIGFSFPFYGNSFGEVHITTEGWISFTSTRTTFSNQPLPNSGTTVPENLIASFWDDLVLRNGTAQEPVASHAYYHYDGTRFIVQWDNFYVIADYDTNFTFQVILYPNGRIVHQYLTMANGRLNSATIGQQNATKDDGLTVVHNLDYMHDGLAIEVSAGADWIALSPTSGTIPAGGSQDVEVLLNAMGLTDGIHEAEINFTSNDPYTPLVTVPVTLNVSLVETTYTDFEPDVLNMAASGGTVKMIVELPMGLDPRMVDACSVLLQDTVPVVGCPGTPPTGAVEFTDEWPVGGNGIEEISLRFSRTEVAAVVGEGENVPVSIQGEVADVQWWRGNTTIRTMHPHVTAPHGGDWFLAGWTVPIRWEAPVTAGVNHYVVQLSRNGGNTWEELASSVMGTAYDWTADATVTPSARVRVVAVDDVGGVVGYDEGDGEFTLAGSVLMRPRPVDGETLYVDHDVSGTFIEWKWPEADLVFGQASGFRILTADSADGDFTERALVGASTYTDNSGDPPIGGCLFYRIVATNAAGDAQQ